MKSFRGLTGFILFHSLICSVLFAGGNPEANTSAAAGGKGAAELIYLEGDVTISGRQAGIGDPVPGGSKIITAAESRCEIVFGDKNIIRIEPETVLVMDLGSLSSSIEMDRGSFGAVFNRLGAFTGNASFRVKTPAAAMAVRGTAFFIAAESEESTYICTCNGTVRQYGPTDENSFEQEVSATHHAAWRYSLEEGDFSVVKGPMLYHDDHYIDMLAGKIGETIPWGSLPDKK